MFHDDHETVPGKTGPADPCPDLTPLGVEGQRDHLVKALGSAGLGTFHLHLPSARLHCSDLMLEIMGLVRASFRGVSDELFEPVHRDDRAAVQQAYRRAACGESEMDIDHRIVRPGGEIRWVHQRAVLTRGAGGEPLALDGTVQDVSGRKHLEHTRSAVARLTDGLSEARQPIDAARLIGTMLDDLFGWDSFFLTLYDPGADVAELVLSHDRVDGRRVEVPPINLAGRPTKLVRRILEGGAELLNRDEETGPPIDSEPFGDTGRLSASLMFVPVRSQDGPCAVLSVQSYRPNAFQPDDLALFQRLADICGGALQRIAAERRLAESEERFRVVFEHAAIGVAVVSPEGRWLRVNEKLCQITGYSAAELMQTDFQAITHPDDLGGALDLVRETLAGERSQYAVEKRYLRKDGRPCWISLSVSLVRDGSGEPDYFVAAVSDITERRALEAQLLRAQRLEGIGTLASGVAHDLNNVLTPILMSIERLRTIAPGAPGLLDSLESSAERGAEVVRQLLTYARGIKGHRVPLEIGPLLGEMVNIARHTFPRSFEVRVELPPGLPRVVGDSTQLHQVLLNLLVNARDAMPEGGTIEVTGGVYSTGDEGERDMAVPLEAAEGNYVSLSVRDSGCGIDAASQEKIFDPFFSTKGPGSGSGLGLSTALGIVRSHGGFFDVKSRPGEGAEFVVYLPVAPEGAPVSTPPRDEGDAPPAPPGGGQEVILVVDDERMILKLAERTLQAGGYRVLTAPGGAEALAHLEDARSRVSLVVTDLNMPGMDGVELIARIRRLVPGLRVIASSGAGCESLPHSGDLAAVVGADRFLVKPYRGQRLLEAVAAELALCSSSATAEVSGAPPAG